MPPHRWKQAEVLETFAEHFPEYRDRAVRRLFENSGIDSRNFVLARDRFDPTADADSLHGLFRTGAVDLAHGVAQEALAQADIGSEDIDLVIATTCTGYLCPGLSAILGETLGLRDDVQRADLVGMGCAGAMPALQRAHDFVHAYPSRRALVITVEVASACWYVDDTVETVVGNTICADGAAAAVVGNGEAAEGPLLEQFGTVIDRRFLDSVGLDFHSARHRIVLSKEVRTAAGPIVRRAIKALLVSNGLARDEVDHWIFHSGGKRVLDSIESALEFPPETLELSREVLRTCGNMSSPTLLFVLERTRERAKPGDVGVLLALGPGLAAETAILRW